MLSDSDINDILPKVNDSSEGIFLPKLAVKFQACTDDKMLSRTDKWFKFVYNFIKIVRYTCLMIESIWIRCPIVIELVYNEFIKILAAANKMKCTESVLSIMEELYNNKNHWITEVIKSN